MKYKNKILFGTILSVFILLTTTVIANVVNNETSTKKEITDYNDEKQIYDTEDVTHLVFQTIIDLTKNEDFLKLIDIKEYNLVMNKNDFRNIYRKIIMEKPMIIFSLLKNKPTFSEDYLEFIYEQGVKIFNLLDEFEINSLINSIKINDEVIKEEMKDIILSNSELRKKFELIDDLNCNCNSDNINNPKELPPPENNPRLICIILFFIELPFYLYVNFIANRTNGLIIPPIAFIIGKTLQSILIILDCPYPT